MQTSARSGDASALRHAATLARRATASEVLRATSADAMLLQGLPVRPQRARVHSVFARALNVALDGERLLTLAQRDADAAPDAIVVDLPSWAPFAITPGADVQLASDRIDFGDCFSVTLAHVRPWQGRLPLYAHSDDVLRHHLPMAQRHVHKHGEGIAGTRAFSPDGSSVDRAMVAAVHYNTDGLCQALAHDDMPRARAHAERLLGLGPGLTPSGDDFLLGLLAALNLPGSPARACCSLGTHVVEWAGKRTHLISAAALRHAANGRVRASVIGLCEALMHATAAQMLSALDQVMRIGSSSGSEIAAGVLAGFRLHLEREPVRRATPGVH